MGGFLTGLIGGYAGQLEKKKDLEYQQEKEARDNRIKYITAAIASGTLDPGARDAAVDELTDLTGGAKKGKGGKGGGANPGDMLKRLIGQFHDQMGPQPTAFEKRFQQSQGAAPAAAPAGAPDKSSPASLGDVPQRQALPEGMVTVGNIDVNHRPVIKNEDGSSSTIFSFTVPLGDGKFALVPSIADGRFLTPDGKKPDEKNEDAMRALEDAARERYQKTGENLGIFSSEEAANQFADATHAYMPTGGDEKVMLPPGAQTMGEPPKRRSVFMTPEEQGKADLETKRPALEYEHKEKMEEIEATEKVRAQNEKELQDRQDARQKLAFIHSDNQLQMRQTFESITAANRERAADLRQSKSLAQQWRLTDKKEADALDKQNDKQLADLVKGTLRDYEQMDTAATRGKQQLEGQINKEGLLHKALIGIDEDMGTVDQQIQNIRDAKQYFIAHQQKILAGTEDYDDVYAQAQLILQSGRLNQVGDIIEGPDKKNYRITSIDADGKLHTVLVPTQ